MTVISRRGAIAAGRPNGPNQADPDATTDAGGWTTTGAASAHAALADTDDASYINTGATTTIRLSLSAVTDPGVGTGHKLVVRAKTSSGGTITAALYEGASARKAATTIGTLQAALTNHEVTLSEAEANAITDYSNLELRLAASPAVLQNVTVAKAYLQVP